MLVMPADHVIPDEPKFLRAVALAVQVAQTGKLVTFGIKPTRPETGYGYIKAAGRHPLLSQGGLKALAVAQFVEKPDLPAAKRYLRAGGFYWNSGIFVWRAEDRKSTRLNSSHLVISYAVFCLKKKKKKSIERY